MRKILRAMVCALSCTFAYAYELGEFVLVDDIPSIVIYVDSTGEHGLFMSATACYDKKEVEKLFGTKSWKSFSKDINVPGITIARPQPGFEDAYLSMPMFDYKKYNDTKIRRQKQLALLRNKTTPYGKENAKIIADFCEENNVDINEYFPEQAWANELGEGWFIPGNAELELYTNFLDIPFGKSHAISTHAHNIVWRFSFGQSLLYDGYGWDGSIFNVVSATFFAPIPIKSSTLIISDWTYLDENVTKIMDFEQNAKLIKSTINQNRNTYIDDYYSLSAFSFGKSMNKFLYMSFYLYGYESEESVLLGAHKRSYPYIVAVKEF